MINYNPKEWFTFIFRFHKADTFRKLFPLIVLNFIYALVIGWLEMDVWKIGNTEHFKSLTILHSILGLVISLLLVFRTNTAYERWWEGRKLWGSLVNSSRNMAIKINAFLPELNKEERAYFSTMIANFAFSLKNHLRGKFAKKEIENTIDFNADSLNENGHIPNQIAIHIANKIVSLEKQQRLKPEYLLMLNNEIQNFADVCGACERIKKTPIPFSYSSFLKKFIFFYVMTMPFGFVFTLGYLVAPVVAFIFYVLASLELIAEEIEDPFGPDANDLPTEEISKTIKKTVTEILSTDSGK